MHYRIADADMQIFFNGRHILPPWKYSAKAPRPLSYLIRRSTLERICQHLLLQYSPNVRIVDGIIRQVAMSQTGSKNVESLQIRGNNGQNSVIQNPALVVGQKLCLCTIQLTTV
jgi:hypothetical protein